MDRDDYESPLQPLLAATKLEKQCTQFVYSENLEVSCVNARARAPNNTAPCVCSAQHDPMVGWLANMVGGMLHVACPIMTHKMTRARAVRSFNSEEILAGGYT